MAVLSITETITLKLIYCANCHIPFAITQNHEILLRETHAEFYCPNGHRNYYPGQNAAEKLRAELKRKEQELADTSIERIKLKNEVAKKDRLLKRIHKGVCPCCNRTFQNLQKHLITKHPDFIKQA